MYEKIKRVIDFVLAAIGLVVFSPLLAVIAISVKLSSRGSVLFKQRRIGKNCTEFMIYKFRTMYSDAPKDRPTHMLDGAQRYITPVGKALRMTSLDELPQLVNILKGDMAIVGPRPALYNQYDLIEARQKLGANDILPGLTGWAQINGRDELSIEEKARLDGEYVAKYGFKMDVRCLVGTVFSVVCHKGVREGRSSEKGA